MIRMLIVAAIIYSMFVQVCFSAELYRYQDVNGQWVFGDKKSLSGASSAVQEKIETVVIQDSRIQKLKPELIYRKVDVDNQPPITQWHLSNPLPVTIQHWLSVKGEEGFFTSRLAKPFENVVVIPSEFELADSAKIEHFYLLGEPIERPSKKVIPPPYSRNKQFAVSQGFKGAFSHSGQGNRYALDIAMPIGESILAVKPGVIADARDDFSMGGAANYFLDKANHVTVMHDDGSYAIYAHILYGSLDVAVGQVVEAGQVLARIGSTGFSTGPHLHFVIRYNSGKGVFSIPFKFMTDEGSKKPIKGRYYLGQLEKIESL